MSVKKNTIPWNWEQNKKISENFNFITKNVGHFQEKVIFGKKIYLSNDIILARFKKNLDHVFEWMKILKLRKNCIILDIGANIGINSICYKKIFKASKIYSFEPIKKTFNALRKNVNKNNLSKSIKTFNFGLSDKKQKASLSIPTKEQGERYKYSLNSGLYSIHGKGKEKIRVNLQTLDQFVNKQKIKKVDFIKIDVEGHEFEILQGALNTIKKFKPIIQSEFNYITKSLSSKSDNHYLRFAEHCNYKIMLLGKGYKIINKPNLNKIKKYNFSDFVFY